MEKEARLITILMADDDEDDQMMVKEAFQEARFINDLRFVRNGEELLDYLCRRGRYANPQESPQPDLILLDLNMPLKDGREVLKDIKADPELRRIPVVVLTTSKAEEDVYRTYDLGVNSFVIKPLSFESLVEVMKTLAQYWFGIVKLPLSEASKM